MLDLKWTTCYNNYCKLRQQYYLIPAWSPVLTNRTQCSKLLLLFWEAQEDSGHQGVTKFVILSSVHFISPIVSRGVSCCDNHSYLFSNLLKRLLKLKHIYVGHITLSSVAILSMFGQRFILHLTLCNNWLTFHKVSCKETVVLH